MPFLPPLRQVMLNGSQVSQLTLEESNGIYLNEQISMKYAGGKAEVNSHLLNSMYRACAKASH